MHISSWLLLLHLVLILPDPATRISGVVKDETGKPLAGFDVELQTIYGTQLYPRAVARTDRNGRYRIDPANAGEWRIRVSGPGEDRRATLLTDKFTLDEKPLVIHFEFPASSQEVPPVQPGVMFFPVQPPLPEPPTYVEIAVVDVLSLKPVAGANVRLVQETEDDETPFRIEGTSDANGRLDFGQLPASMFQVEIVASGYQEPWKSGTFIRHPMRIRIYLLPDDHDMRTFFRPSGRRGRAFLGDGSELKSILNSFGRSPYGTLSGRIMMQSAAPEGIRIELVGMDGSPLHRFLETRLMPDGSFTMQAIEPGTYTLRIFKPEGPVDIPNVVVAAGPNDLRLSM